MMLVLEALVIMRLIWCSLLYHNNVQQYQGRQVFMSKQIGLIN